MVMLTPEEWKDVDAYDRYTAAQMAERDQPELKPYTLSDHLDTMLRSYGEEISFLGADIGNLSKIRTTFRKNPMIVGLCDMHIRICNDMMMEALEKVNEIRAEQKSCRV